MEELIAEAEEPEVSSSSKGKKGGKGGKGGKKTTDDSKTQRLTEVSERLEAICSNDAETKAIEILSGIGFS